ncbi:MAG: dTMP kinase [Eubacteriales bacterium]
MIKNYYSGKLIAVDGPNGVGKTTVINKAKNLLENKGYRVYISKEPTKSDLGEFLRSFAEENTGESVACLVAADRYYHIHNEILPMLEQGYIVILDRYILSSLILQRMDNVELKLILAINEGIIQPDLQIALNACENVIQKRLNERSSLTRFEKNNRSAIEIEYMHQGVEVLKQIGVECRTLSTECEIKKSAQELTMCISDFLKKIEV